MIDSISLESLSNHVTVVFSSKDFRGYWLGEVDWGTVEGSHNAYNYYDQVGADIASTTIRTRRVSITGWVIENNEDLQDRCDFLNKFISPVENYALTYNNRVIIIRPDASIKYSRVFKENNRKARKFLIQATAPNPLFTAAEDTKVDFDILQKFFRFPTSFGDTSTVVFGAVSRMYSATVMIEGGFQTGMVARLTFNGQVTNPRVKNVTTGGFVGVNYTFSTGDVLVISTIKGRKSITLYSGEAETNLLKYRDFRTTWIQLEPGKNVIGLECDAGDVNSIDAVITYTPLFLEVE